MEIAGDDVRLAVAEMLVEGAGGGVDGVGVHAQTRAAALEGMALVKGHEVRADALSGGVGIDHQRVQHEDLARIRRESPAGQRVFRHLHLVDARGGDDPPLALVHEQDIRSQRLARRRFGGVYAALPAGRARARLLAVVDALVNGGDGGDVARDGFANHGDTSCAFKFCRARRRGRADGEEEHQPSREACRAVGLR